MQPPADGAPLGGSAAALQLEFAPPDQPDGVVKAQVDTRLAACLKPHQKEGVQTLFRRLGGGRPGYGAVLGDGMGLGKTVQAITLVLTLLGSDLCSSALILVPSGLLATWRRELRKWLEGVEKVPQVDVVSDDAQHGHAGAVLERLRTARPGSPRLVVLSYERFWRATAWIGEGGRSDVLVCDEAHTLKNPATLAARAVASLPNCARLLLTATPIQNVLLEMHTLATLASPGVWGSTADFVRAFVRPIDAARHPGASDAHRLEGALARLHLEALVGDLVLARESKTVQAELGLPTPHVYTLLLPVAPVQRLLHTALTAGQLETGVAFQRLQLMQQMLIHPCVLEASRSSLARHVSAALPRAWPVTPRDVLLASPATAAAVHILERALEVHERVIVTSSSIRALELFAKYLTAANVGFARIIGDDGESTQARASRATLPPNAPKAQHSHRHPLPQSRAETGLNDPLSSIEVLLLSVRLGAGRTLTGANHLILLDPSWNYKQDEQVLGRLYRPSQTRETHHYRLVIQGSVSEEIVIKQQSKQDLAAMTKAGAFRRLPEAKQRRLMELDAPDAPSRLLQALGYVPADQATSGSASAETEEDEADKDDLPASMFGSWEFGRPGSQSSWLPLRPVTLAEPLPMEDEGRVPVLAVEELVGHMLHACELQWTN